MGKTAQDVITDFQELASDQQEKVIQFVLSVKEQEDTNFLNRAFAEECVHEENYSPEDMAKIDHDLEEAKRGINVTPTLSGKEAIFYLRQFRKA